LFTFAIPNALGLILFGLFTQQIANRKTGGASLEEFFEKWAKPFRFILYLYQFLAITLTIFAFLRYFWQPLGLEPDMIYIPLTILIVLAVGILFGEEFNIERIKWSHGAIFLFVIVAIAILWGELQPSTNLKEWEGHHPFGSTPFWGYAIPLVCGLLLGPWLDLQQWQRAIQARRESVSIADSYLIGGLLFFGLLIFHGLLAQWVLGNGAVDAVRTGMLNLPYAQGIVTNTLLALEGAKSPAFLAYALFICLCILTTLDSGYVSLKWFLAHNAKKSDSVLLSLLPGWIFTSPIPTFLIAGFVSLIALYLPFELEFFMVVFATFFVGYEILGFRRSFSMDQTAAGFPQIKLFFVGSVGLVLFAYGYFMQVPLFQMIGALLPCASVLWLLLREDSATPVPTTATATESAFAPAAATAPAASADSIPAPVPTGDQTVIYGGLEGHFDDEKWFNYSFVATYSDTNSVGNVYFGMYAMYVGKVRELFFRKALPDFDLDTTNFYILTRSFEHKFLREAKEFDEITVRIKVGDYNRKFANLEHQILDGSKAMLGKGKQSLMFVSAGDYSLIDIPQSVHLGFSKYM
ncbi:MAG: acyl-CoA thioesterase, partial [Verrucomicrobiota bacterium]